MKKIIITTLSVVFALFLINSCRKSNINGDAKDLTLGSYITLDSIINENLNFSDPTASVSIIVGSSLTAVASINIFHCNRIKRVGYYFLGISKKCSLYQWPGIVCDYCGNQCSFGESEPDYRAWNAICAPKNEVVTVDGRYFSVSNTPSNYNSLPGYNMALSWQATAVCAFSQASSIGLYQVTFDGDWQDFQNGDTINVFPG